MPIMETDDTPEPIRVEDLAAEQGRSRWCFEFNCVLDFMRALRSRVDAIPELSERSRLELFGLIWCDLMTFIFDPLRGRSRTPPPSAGTNREKRPPRPRAPRNP